jgi:pimeloyl-[acyl-carrier protein] methyl ester esterase
MLLRNILVITAEVNNMYKQTMVLLSGWGFDTTIWEIFIAQFPTDFHFITINLFDFFIADTELKTLADISLQLNQLIPKNSVLLGWSLGGLIALDFYIRSMKPVTLVTVACSPKFIAENNWLGISLQEIESFKQMLETDLNSLLKKFASLVIYPVRDWRLHLRIRNAFQKQQHKKLLVLLNRMETADLRSDFQLLAKPSLHLLGSEDVLIPKATERQLKKLNTKASVEIIEGAGHIPFLTHPENCLNQLEKFLKQ